MVLFSLQFFVKELGVTMVSHHSLFVSFVIYCGFLHLFLLHSQQSIQCRDKSQPHKSFLRNSPCVLLFDSYHNLLLRMELLVYCEAK